MAVGNKSSIFNIYEVYILKTASTGSGKCFMSWDSFYAPNFEEIEGAYWFGPVRLSVTPFVSCKTREPLEIGT